MGINFLIWCIFLRIALTKNLPFFTLTIIDDESSLTDRFIGPLVPKFPTCCIWESEDCSHWELPFRDGTLHLFSASLKSARSFLVTFYVLSSYIIVNGNSGDILKDFNGVEQQLQSLNFGSAISHPVIREFSFRSLARADLESKKGNSELSRGILADVEYKKGNSEYLVGKIRKEIEHKKIHQRALEQRYFYELIQDAELVEKGILDKSHYKVLGVPPWKREVLAASFSECWENNSKPKCAFTIGEKELKILGKIGSGHHGLVYRVIDRNGEIYALKHVFSRRDPIFFETEQQILLQLNESEVVVKTYGSIVHELGLFILMEHGHCSLWDIAQEKEYLSIAQLQIYFRQMAEAVQFLHARDIVHMDVKPNNFVFFRGKIKIIDFESATYKKRDLIAKFGYSLEDADFTSDIYGLGMSMYVMITKQTSTLVWFNKIPKAVRGYQQASAAVNVGFSKECFKELHALLEGCMHKDLSRRFSIPEILAHPFMYVH
eukprot:Phypoly_transcript_05958.p1 GENE.Phypoly_transcript_05958~~Phypoly_transcript_05958.p1  ORF type:complete len:491 (+),score=52.17 Phypoly_transcript_05958:66-1538(+)